MDYPKYQLNFMPESYFGYCSTACFMWILNYFWYTQFNMKDTRDVMKIAKLGTYSFWCWLDETEIAYASYKLWFTVDYFSWYSEKELLEYIKDPIPFLEVHTKEKYKKYIKEGKWVDGNWNTTFDLADTAVLEKVMTNDDIKKHYQNDIEDIIEKNQADNVLFVLWLNWYVLFNEKELEWESWGHVVLCKWIKDWLCEIYDPGPHQKPVFIDIWRVSAAMNEMWPYVCIMVKHTI